jgi:acyl transferase domain-containing protein/NADPH:quinone reductase-like Zn-dependent oxidoreductase/NAD(P)-dependent dehydrogenase (short-subunit alcohol dehydrogenase family)/SAM-dependent methyltransferase/acyl carrier protein
MMLASGIEEPVAQGGGLAKTQGLLLGAAQELRRLRAELDARDAAEREPVAIIGMACRLPGGVDSPEAFWTLLRNGVDATGEIPAGRWDVDAYYDPDPEVPGRMYTRRGSFLDDVAQFDPQFFGISPREARHLDPQQRLLLCCAHEAFENAAVPVDALRGTNTGVYVGLSFDDYAQRSVRSGDPCLIDAHGALGTQRAVAAGRIAYVMGLQGPTMQIDTTCSSSLVSVHLACQALRRRETDLALVGGVNLMLAPEATIGFCKLQALSPDGRCRTFADDADGYGRGEGCGLLVLKRLADARADGDRVLALVRGSAVNHDGVSNGLTAPNGQAQTAVIRDALRDARLDGEQIDYVEAHGTGTPLGDPIELEALHAALGRRRRPLLVGSVKTNIGHLEPAAGAAGLIKIVLAMQAGRIPPHLHCVRPSRRVDWSRLGFEIPQALAPWPHADAPMRAGVSGFGLSGTNAHVIVESAPAADAPAASGHATSDASEKPATSGVQLLPLSARCDEALRALAAAYAGLVRQDGSQLDAVCDAARRGRAHFSRRRAFVATDAVSMQQQLDAFAAGDGDAGSPPKPRILFLYTGQGAQYLQMGRALHEREAVFRDTIEACDDVLGGALGLPLRALLYPTDDTAVAAARIDDTGNAQPILFAIQYALTRLWASWGIGPSVVLGHSVGELAAACCAGAMDWHDGLRLIAARARLMQALPTGAMLAVSASAQAIGELLGPSVSLAALNGPESVVVAGSHEAIEQATARCRQAGIECRRLAVSHAFHSPMMAPMRPALAGVAGSLDYAAPKLSWVSSVTGKAVGGCVIGADHWVDQLCSPVRFAQAMAAIDDGTDTVFVEIGPQATLLGMARQCTASTSAGWLPSLRPPRPGQPPGSRDHETIYAALAGVYEAGHDVEWRRFGVRHHRAGVRLPNYPFTGERYWLEPAPAAVPRSGGGERSLPGRAIPLAGDRLRCFELLLDVADAPQWSDHKINGRVLWPASGSVATVCAAYRQLVAAAGDRVAAIRCRVSDLRVRKPLWLDAASPVLVQTQMSPQSGRSYRFDLFCGDGGRWTSYASGTIGPAEGADPKPVDLQAFSASLDQVMTVADFYTGFEARGISYGPRYRRIAELRVGGDAVLARLALGAGCIPGELADPCMVDAGLQTVGALLQQRGGTPVPVGVDSLDLYEPLAAACWIQVLGGDSERTRVRWLDADGRVLAVLKGLRLRTLTKAGEATIPANLYYGPRWVEQPLPLPPARWLPSPADVAAATARGFADALGEPAAVEVQVALPELDRLALAYMARALAGPDDDPAQTKGANGSSVATHHRRLVDHCARLLAATTQPPSDPVTLQVELKARHRAASIELALIGAVGAHLGDILRGRVDPLAVLFPDGDGSALHALYGTAPGARLINGQLCRALDRMLATDARRPLRILEIGAGTGGTTLHVLKRLSALGRDFEYDFTDVSAQLLQQARTRFASASGMRFRLLDIERPVQGQGRYDIVIASNVLHAAADLVQALVHVRKLLAPGGALLMVEGTTRMAWLDLVFGITAGWWRFADSNLRPDHPLLPVEGWRRACAQAGFAGFEPLLPADTPAPAQTVMLAQTAERAGDLCVLGDDEQAAALASALGRLGQPVERHSAAVRDDAAAVVVVLPALGETDDPALMARAFTRQVFVRVQALARAPGPGRLIVVCGGDAERDRLARAPLWGLLQATAIERPTLHLGLIIAADAHAIAAEIRAGGRELAVQLVPGSRRVARIAAIPSADSTGGMSRRLVSERAGTLDTLTWRPEPLSALADDAVEIRVHASGLNFRDLLIAMDLYPEPAGLGCECVGEVVRVGNGVTEIVPGRRVMAIGAGCFAERVRLPQALVRVIPEALDWDAAATLPVCFATAGRALLDLARIKEGDSVLIHNATGGVGQAALQIARQCGARVFASAGRGKWSALRALGVDAPLDSRDLAFADVLLEQTGGRGVDVVLNALPGEFRRKGLEVLTAGGRFIEIGKGEGLTPEEIAKLRPDVDHHVLDLAALCAEQPDRVGALLSRIATEVSDGNWQPLPLTAFPADQAVDAFRTMQGARHIGKLVIRARPSTPGVSAPGSLSFKPDAAYLITGGLGGLGLAVARWMVERGARRLLLLGRSPATTATQRQAVQALRDAGADVRLLRADASDAAGLEAVLAPWLGHDCDAPLRGLIHAAGVMHDGPIGRLDWAAMDKVLAPKLDGAWHLHRLTEALPLEFFVTFSSAVGLLGAPGQCNHAAANRFLDALAGYRRSLGLPALSIAWGPWSAIGAAVKYARDDALGAIPGVGMIPPQQAIAYLEQVWNTDLAEIAIVPLDVQRLLDQPPLAELPLFEQLAMTGRKARTDRAEAGTATAAGAELRERLERAPVGERRALLDRCVCDRVGRVLGFQADRLDRSAGLFDLGLDSLTALELKNGLQRDLGLDLPSTLVFDYPTVDGLLGHLADLVLKDQGDSAAGGADVHARISAAAAPKAATKVSGDLASQLDDTLDEIDALLEGAGEDRA